MLVKSKNNSIMEIWRKQHEEMRGIAWKTAVEGGDLRKQNSVNRTFQTVLLGKEGPKSRAQRLHFVIVNVLTTRRKRHFSF